MNSAEALSDKARLAREFTSRFFAAPNRFARSHAAGVSEGADAAIVRAIEPALAALEQGRTEWPVLLPLGRDGDSETTWYAHADGASRLRLLTAELRAFIGPSFADFPPGTSGLDVNDPFEAAIRRSLGSRVLKFRAARSRDTRIAQQWSLYWGLLKQRPPGTAYVPLTFAQLRASFDRALSAGNEGAAREAITALREQHFLSAENQTFLEIRLFAALGRWEAIASHRLLPALMALRLPAETYGDIFQALYQTRLRPLEAAGDADALIEQFRQTVAVEAAPLFRTRDTSRRPDVFKAFVLYELTQDTPDPAVFETLLEDLASGAFGAAEAVLRAKISGFTQPPVLAQAIEAMDAQQFERAFALLWPLPDAGDVLARLVSCAREIEDPQRAAIVLERVDAAQDVVRDEVRRSTPHHLERVEGLAARSATPAPTWALRIAYGGPARENANDFLARWREGAQAWDPRVMVEEPDFGVRAADALIVLSIEHPDLLEEVLPLWVDLFVERAEPDSRLIPIYQNLLETLRARDSFSDSDLTLCRDVLAHLLKAGPTASAYKLAVDEVIEIFNAVRSPQILGWALDVCDVLAIMQCRDADSKLRMLTATIQAANDFGSRLSSVQRELVRLLASESGLDVKFPEDVGAPDQGKAAGANLRVVLHSLDKEAMRRAKGVLETLFPGMRIDSNADEVRTPQLTALTKAASFVVVAWKCCKHQAFWGIKEAVISSDRIVMASGKGMTSLVDAVAQKVSDVALSEGA